MVDVSEVAKNIYLIDNGLYSFRKWGGVYLINEDKKALVDIGPATAVGAVLAGIKQMGVSPEEIDYVIATHIHMDHIGGVGTIIRSMPRAQVFAHYKGTRTLVNPAKLVAGVVEFQGADTLAKNGEMVPIEEGRVTPVHDGDTLRLSEGQLLRFIEAPGHAPHELSIYESRNNGVFLGDAVGMYFAGKEVLLPITPPPGFNAEQYVETLEKLMKLSPEKLYFAHFGASSRVRQTLQAGLDKAHGWADLAAGCENDNQLAEKLTAQRHTDLEPLRGIGPLYEHLKNHHVGMGVAGYMKYHREKCEAGS